MLQAVIIKMCLFLQKIKHEYKYDQSSNQWIQQDECVDGILEKGVLVRYRVTTLKYLHNDFVSILKYDWVLIVWDLQSVVGTIDEDYLGITKAATM